MFQVDPWLIAIIAIGTVIGTVAPFVLCGWWLKSKNRSLWYLLLLPVLGIFALIVFALLENRSQHS